MSQGRIEEYLRPELENICFAEFTRGFFKDEVLGSLMKGVSVPFTKEEYAGLQAGKEVSVSAITDNMLKVLGCHRDFAYSKHYVVFLFQAYKEKILDMALTKADEAAEAGDFLKACIYYRASLAFKNDSLRGLYGYGRVCRELYLAGDDEEYVGNFKAEALETFETLTEFHPEFAEGFYYLGYGYVNLGLYTKAKITWESYMKLAEDESGRKEIKERLTQLQDPVKIEQGVNHVLAGRYPEGIRALEGYTRGAFSDWWPLWYYLGIAYNRLEEYEQAVPKFKEALKYSPSNVEVMKELAMAYSYLDDYENEKKYMKKIDLIMGH